MSPRAPPAPRSPVDLRLREGAEVVIEVERRDARSLPNTVCCSLRRRSADKSDVVAKPSRIQRRANAGTNPYAAESFASRRVVAIPCVAPEQLVAALARQHNFHALGRQSRHEVERNARGPGDRLVLVPDEPRQRLEELLLRDGHLVMSRADVLGDIASKAQFAVASLAVADGEGLHRLAAQALHDRGDDARVDAAAQEHAQRHVAHQPQPHRLFDRPAAARDEILLVRGRRRRRGNVPVAAAA